MLGFVRTVLGFYYFFEEEGRKRREVMFIYDRFFMFFESSVY